MPHAHDLERRACGVRQRAEQIKCGADAELAPHVCHPCGCCVKEWGKHETDSVLIETPFNPLWRANRVYTERFKDVGASGLGGDRACPVFCYRHTRAGDHEGGRCGDIESFRSARSGSGGVYEIGVTRTQWSSATAHRLGHSRELLDCFTFGGEHSQSAGDLRICGRRIEQRVEKICGFAAGEIFTAHQTHCHFANLEIAGFSFDVLRVHETVIWVAIASAFIIARALLSVSSYSRSGSESATIPAPAWKYACPSFNTAHRSAMQESMFPSNPK